MAHFVNYISLYLATLFILFRCMWPILLLTLRYTWPFRLITSCYLAHSVSYFHYIWLFCSFFFVVCGIFCWFFFFILDPFCYLRYITWFIFLIIFIPCIPFCYFLFVFLFACVSLIAYPLDKCDRRAFIMINVHFHNHSPLQCF